MELGQTVCVYQMDHHFKEGCTFHQMFQGTTHDRDWESNVIEIASALIHVKVSAAFLIFD
jgi:hypothetical protein